MFPSHLSLSIGTLLSQRYRIEELIGEGAIAQVYRATDLLSNRVVAIKILRADLARLDEAIARLRREGEILRSLRHPALVAVESVGEEDGRIYLVMELLRGRTLRERMQRGQMGVHELVPIVTEAASALSLAHSHGVIHRDLKPENIFLLPDHPTQHTRIKILDFGISKVLSAKTLTETGEILGTPRYIAPEQLNAEPIDARVDVYALGVILYEALAARPPFSANTLIDLVVAILDGKVTPLRTFRPDISPELESVVLCAMARKREERFQSVEAMARAFVVASQPLTRQGGYVEHRTYLMGEMGAYSDGPRLLGPSPQGIDLGTFSRVLVKQPITQSREKREEEK
ncbi:MAG: serine/threonine protein kinase, partial [Sandaracinaceae bacterium]|nr:serine/threonine protein kinase [Sandaracinaceae bacterium]